MIYQEEYGAETTQQEERDFFRYVLEGYGNRTEVNYYVRTVARNLYVGVVVAKRAKKHQQLDISTRRWNEVECHCFFF